MNRIVFSILTTVLVFFVREARAEIIVRDHQSSASLWTNTANAYNHSEGSATPADGWVASAFVGNGQSTLWVEGLFMTEKQGVPNGGNFHLKDFRVVMYEDQSAFFAPTWRTGTQVFTFSEPANAGWDSPIDTVNGFDLYRMRFYVDFATTLDQTHYFSIVPFGSSGASGVSFIRFSSGGDGAIGSELDLFRNQHMGPGTLLALGAPYNYGATTIALVPAPGTVALLGVAAALGIRRRRS